MKRDSEADLKAQKEEIRRVIRGRLRALDSAFRAEASLVICELAAQLPAFRAGKCIGLFAPLASEPDLHPLIEEAWAEAKTVLLPRLWREGTAPHLEWHAVKDWSEMTDSGPFGLREPDPERCPRVEPAQIDCVFVPGLAFDSTGLRLGRGGGYYDYFLSRIGANVPRFGIMFASQQTENLPRQPHDQALPAIVTEDGVVSFSS